MTIRILHLEDSEIDAELVRGHLRRAGSAVRLSRAVTRDEFLDGLAEGPDLILADHALPEFDGFEALRLARREVPAVPFIFVSGTLGEEIAIQSLRDGATDYVLKQNLRRLVPAIERALAEAALRAERERTEAQRRATEAQLKVLVAELSHRVGNIFAVVQSVAQQTLRNSEDLPSFEQRFLARIHSLAQTHSLLIRSDWRGASLEEILRTELAPFQGPRPRWSLRGPEVDMGPGAALTMALIFHELATNAAKYGALGDGPGHVSVDWDWSRAAEGPDARLRVHWRERHGPPVRPPTRRGFGSRLIAQISRSLQGSAQVNYGPDGLSCRIDLPSALLVPEDLPDVRVVIDGMRQSLAGAGLSGAPSLG
jgi:two-component sensor histidine kinase/CheY-like chemotaxis protein